MKYIVLVPVFNDWECLVRLRDDLHQLFERHLPEATFELYAINDFSTQSPDEGTLKQLHIIHLNRNLGHQRAIAVGLAYVAATQTADKVIVMDADGEDQPQDILKLINSQVANHNSIVFAQRKKRKEGVLFRVFYHIYKFLFRLLTGHPINFGNFSLLDFSHVKKIVHVPELWNHFAGSVIRSKLPFVSIPIEKGWRYAGQSKMNFSSLILHGLSAISVYIETVSVRLIVFSLYFLLLAMSGIATVVSIRIFTTWAIPGWATLTVLALAIISFQAFIVFLFLVFMVLSHRSNTQMIIAQSYAHFIHHIETKS